MSQFIPSIRIGHFEIFKKFFNQKETGEDIKVYNLKDPPTIRVCSHLVSSGIMAKCEIWTAAQPNWKNIIGGTNQRTRSQGKLLHNKQPEKINGKEKVTQIVPKIYKIIIAWVSG